MTEKFIGKRITELRMKASPYLSERQLSKQLGKSPSYIQKITSGASIPPFTELLRILEFFGMTPKDFFDDEYSEPILLRQVNDIAKHLSERDLQLLLKLMNRFDINKNGCE